MRCPKPNKLKYNSRAAARRAARRTNQRFARAYHCACGRWHLTTMTHHDRARALKYGHVKREAGVVR